jgi:hypothetical protein
LKTIHIQPATPKNRASIVKQNNSKRKNGRKQTQSIHKSKNGRNHSQKQTFKKEIQLFKNGKKKNSHSQPNMERKVHN